MALRTRNAVLLAKIETTPGVESAPSASTDAILCENIAVNFNPNVLQTNEYSGSLDGLGPIVGGMYGEVSFDFYLKGSGVPETPPEFGDILKACGMAEVITSTAVPASAEAAASGGSTTTAVLGTSASSSAQAYRGMPIIFTGAVPGTTFIADYTAGKVATLAETLGGAIVATTSYQIPKNVLYKLASTSIPSLTLYFYVDGVLYKFVGARGAPNTALSSGGPGRITARVRAMFVSKTDASVPLATYDATRPPIWKNGTSRYNRLLVAVNQLTVDFGAQITNPDNPEALEGFDVAEIVSRRMTGQIDPNETLVATRDLMGDFRAGNQRILHARWGSVAGNRVALTLPTIQAVNQTPSDRQGIATATIPFEAPGQDAGMFLCFW